MKHLYYGDNLTVLRDHLASESVDLIYLDPPFNSQADYNVFFRDQGGQDSGAQFVAFKDTWRWGHESQQALEDLVSRDGILAQFLQDTVLRLGHNDLSAYLVMMGVRLVELRRVLKPSGSLYLHCDPTASHYLKLILDVIFGPQNFRAEIIWKRSSAHNDTKQGAKQPGKLHDTILFYSKGKRWTWNPVFMPYQQDYLDAHYRNTDPDGRRYKDTDLTAAKAGGDTNYDWWGVRPPPGRYWAYSKGNMQRLEDEGRLYYTRTGMPRLKQYVDEMPGLHIQSIWDDISPLNSQAQERLGYPTQKPLALLERIIQASSNPGDVVLDPFCGCGTTISAAEKLGREWIGIDVTHLSVSLIKARLKRDFDLIIGQDYQEIGTPRDVTGAQYFADQDPFQFQFWIVGEIGAQPYGAVGDSKKGKKGGDTGIDGQMFFRTPDGGKIERVIVSVKAGRNLNPAMVRDLRGTVEREKAAVGVLLLAHEPTRGMVQEAAQAGAYIWEGRTYPKLQILTVAQLLAGEQPLLPRGAVNVSYDQKEAKSLTGKKAKDKGAAPLFVD